jgi:RNA polymerase sigma-70 factor (ECF subfamily)
VGLPGSGQADDDLIAAIGEGDKSALQELYFRHAAPLQRMVELWSGEATIADDLVQETFLAVWRNAGRFEGRSSVKTWIYSIARNKSLDHRRGAGREDPQEVDENLPDPAAPNSEALLEAASDARRVRDCVAALNAPHRRAIELAFYQDMDYREIAAIEDVPVGTIKTRIFHAKQKLLHCLGAFTWP